MKRSTTPKTVPEKRTLNLPRFRSQLEICVTPSSSVADIVSFFNTSKRLSNSFVYRSFVPLPVTEKSNWIHEVSLRSFSATAISASWFSSSSGWSLSGAVFHATTSRIRQSSHVVNPPCLRVPNLLSRIPTVKQIEPLLSAIRVVIHKPSRCQSTDTCPSHQFLVSTPKFPPDL